MHWVKNPSEKNSRMPGALKKFGIMPYQSFPEETVIQIAEYLYDNEIDTPDWFQSHTGKGQGKGRTHVDFTLYLNLAMMLFDELFGYRHAEARA